MVSSEWSVVCQLDRMNKERQVPFCSLRQEGENLTVGMRLQCETTVLDGQVRRMSFDTNMVKL